jgi:hypothetical protein
MTRESQKKTARRLAVKRERERESRGRGSGGGRKVAYARRAGEDEVGQSTFSESARSSPRLGAEGLPCFI